MTQQYSSLADFEDWEIEAYLDDVPIDHLTEFLAEHPAAQAELAEQKARSAHLQSTLYRFDCPEPAEMQAYQLHELSAAQHQQIAAHLHHCPHCNAELAALQAFADEPLFAGNLVDGNVVDRVETVATVTADLPPQPSLLDQLQDWVDQVRVVVATLATPGGLQFSGVALRSETVPTASAASAMLLFETDDADVSLAVNRQPDSTYRIDGQIFATAPFSAAHFVLTSADASNHPVMELISNSGTFVAEHLPAGIYQLVIKVPEKAIVIPNLSLM